ncbi:MAG TPA: tetratricopeptide repeat protein [Thermoplasmata archaeon]|nr:tetratricopeptide repeat protein [Thermoplasmata archaeon]
MDEEQLDRLNQQVEQKKKVNDFRGALNIVRKMLNFGPYHRALYLVGANLIIIGDELRDKNIIKEGIEILQKNFKKIISEESYAPYVYYNLAKGYYALFKIRKDPYYVCFKQRTELNRAKDYYRKALEYNPQDNILLSQIWIELGNCFDDLGMVIDAMECYEEALKISPDDGFALGNKGMTLLNYASLISKHQGTFLIEAYSLLSQAIKCDLHNHAIDTFSKCLEDIISAFPNKKALDNPPEFLGYSIETDNNFERFLIEFCLKNGLYLNICNFCQKCNEAIGDAVTISRMVMPIEDIISINEENIKKISYFRFSAYLNQIKQDYVSSRFLLILSRYKDIDLNFVDRNVSIIDTLDYSMHNIYIELIKLSFKNFYDILDKIAYFLNEYLELGVVHDWEIDFRKIWYSNRGKKENKKVRKKIEEKKNLSLNALFNIHLDFEDGGTYENLRRTRNALTHRFVNIKLFQTMEDSENMKEETLVKKTIELAKIVRNAILYLLYFVYIEESRKKKQIGENVGVITPPKIPDDLKSSR